MKIFKKKYHNIDYWYFDFTCYDKRYRRKIAPCDSTNRVEAKREAMRQKAAIINSDNEAEKRATCKDVFDNYEKYLKAHKKSTHERLGYFFKHYRYFHSKRFKISAMDIDGYKRKRLLDGVSGATINRELQMARTAFNRAIKQDLWNQKNPFKGFDKFQEEERVRYLTPDELLKLIEVCQQSESPYLYHTVIIAILTGKRLNEILTLHRDDIDLTTMCIVKKATGTVKYKRNKSTPITKTVMDIFKERLSYSKNGWVFENPDTHSHIKCIRRAWYTAVKKAKLKDFRFHDLRHTFATYALLVGGGDLRTLQELMGHSTITQTSKYAHVVEEQKNMLISSIDQFIVSKIDKNLDKNKPVEKNRNDISGISWESACLTSRMSGVRAPLRPPLKEEDK
jgi:integrase